MMKQFTGNYSVTEHNFVIQNLPVVRPIPVSDLQVIAVLKNILLRGTPTILSIFLQEKLDLRGYIDARDFQEKIPLISSKTQKWFNTIGGDVQNSYFPAKEFYNSIPLLFPEFHYIGNLIRPEAPIQEILEECPEEFTDQRVDFYLEQARLVIEIDGSQHLLTNVHDMRRGEVLQAQGIQTVRIKTSDIRNKTPGFRQQINEISNRLIQFKSELNACHKSEYTESDHKCKLIPTAIFRWQILLISLLEAGAISLKDKKWKLNVRKSDIDNFATLATDDLLIWLENLLGLHNTAFIKPEIEISTQEQFRQDAINVDFSLFSKWTDENELAATTIFVRSDYSQTRNYFRVSSCTPVKYELKEEKHQKILRFFLNNVFNKLEFREGQLSIICNALNRNDTIGLLPTGAGKSICYQLTSILQPGVSFVISPLKSLMIDQKENLDKSFFSNTNYISSDQSTSERTRVQKEFANGKYLLIWISPERFQIKTFREYLKNVNAQYRIIYAVIDEVHCLSEWGHDFRTSYLNIARTIRQFCPDSKYIGLTATASSRVHKDIKAEFDIDEANIKSLTSFDRKELTFYVQHCTSSEKLRYTKKIIHQFNQATDFLNIEGKDGKAGIIFTPHVNWKFGCYGVFTEIQKDHPGKINFYSGEVPHIKIDGVKTPIMPEIEYDQYKFSVQRNFQNSQFPLLTATKAFGMGIDKPNINLTIHYGIPASIESLYQEAGRAGRHQDKNDKAKSDCYILFSDESNDEIKEVIDNLATTFSRLFDIQEKYRFQGDDMFRQLFFYTESFVGEATELTEIVEFTQAYYVKNEEVSIRYHNGRDKQRKEKSIYRLTLLNVVKDYTINYTANCFDVTFLEKSDQTVFEGLHKYINKYDPISQDDLQQDLNKLPDQNQTARCLRYLIHWIYDNIAYERRQSLKGVAELCRGYENPEEFKRMMVAYFEVNESTFILQHIAENPSEYLKWFDVFKKRNKKNEIIGYILKERQEKENLKLKLQRFLESYKTNAGLNFISGIVRLFLGEFGDQDGVARFENALGQLDKLFDPGEKLDILEKTLEYGDLLDSTARHALSKSLLKFFDQNYQIIYEKLGDGNSLQFLLNVQVNRLTKVNNKLYGELKGIE